MSNSEDAIKLFEQKKDEAMRRFARTCFVCKKELTDFIAVQFHMEDEHPDIFEDGAP